MAIGYTLSKQAVDSALGGLAIQGRQWASQAQIVVGAFTDIQDADLTTLGYTVDDITQARAFLTDVASMLAVISGASALPEAKNFLDSAKPLTGVN